MEKLLNTKHLFSLYIMETCCVCFEEVKEPYQQFYCSHVMFHKQCIRKCRICPLCRSSINPLLNEPRILIWCEEQRIPAELYKSSRNLNHEIVVYKTGDDTKLNDIFYHFSR